MRKSTKYLALLLVIAMVCSMFAGCGGQSEPAATEAPAVQAPAAENNAPAAEEPQETVNIVWHRQYYHVNTDEKTVQDAINAYIEPKIGVTVTILNAQEGTPLETALPAGDDIDIFWTGSGPLSDYLANGITYNLSDVIENYPDLYNAMPEFVWEGSKYNGDIHWVPVYKEMGNGYALMVEKSLVEKYGWDVSQIKELKDIEPMLAELKADGVTHAFKTTSGGWYSWGADDYSLIYESLVGVKRGGTKVENSLLSDEYMEFCNLMYSWNQAGYINQDEIDTANPVGWSPELFDTGDYGFGLWSMTPDGVVNASTRYGRDMVIIPLTGTYLGTNTTAGSCYAINANTEKVDACLKFLQLLYTDPVLADLATWGVEGTHYTKNADGRIVKIADSGFSASAWHSAPVTVLSLLEGESADKVEQYETFNSEVVIDDLCGFRYSVPAEVEAYKAACDSVIAEYRDLLEKGFYDPAVYIPKFAEALEKAGIQNLIDAYQAQLDEWMASK